MSSLLVPPLISAAPQFLSPRVHIPPHVYKHPAAILLELCASMKELHQIIPLIVKNGLYNEHLFQTKLVSLFCKFGSLSDAVKVFEPIESNFDSAFKFFARMKHDGVEPNVYNFSYLLKACADNFDVRRDREIHAQLVLNGLSVNLFAMTSVMKLYSKCGVVEDACKMFDRMPERDLICWNTVIAGFSQNGMSRKALELVAMMQKEQHKPDLVTVVSILPAIADLVRLRIAGLGNQFTHMF